MIYKILTRLDIFKDFTNLKIKDEFEEITTEIPG